MHLNIRMLTPFIIYLFWNATATYKFEFRSLLEISWVISVELIKKILTSSQTYLIVKVLENCKSYHKRSTTRSVLLRTLQEFNLTFWTAEQVNLLPEPGSNLVISWPEDILLEQGNGAVVSRLSQIPLVNLRNLVFLKSFFMMKNTCVLFLTVYC